MAWEATYLLSPILLVLLASGFGAEDTELFQAVEVQTFSVECRYSHSQQVNLLKVWCQQTSTERCKLLVSSLSTDTRRPKFSIRDHPGSCFFTVNMTALTARDSGRYYCGFLDNLGIIGVLRRFHLVVSRDSSDPSTSDIITTILPMEASTRITIKSLRRDRTMTPSTAAVSSPDPGVTYTNMTNVPRVSISSIMVPMVCGLLSKTIIFNVLFAVTWRSFGEQTMKPHNSGL